MECYRERAAVILESLEGIFAYLCHRLKIPKSRMIENVLRIFVKTGPRFDDCNDRVDVEVDLIENGKLQSGASAFLG